MILDENLEFADATSVGTPNNSTVNVGDSVDLGAVTRDIGVGRPLYLVIQVTEAITSGGAAKVRFKLSSDSTSTLSVDGTQTEHATTDDIAKADLTAGKTFVIPLPGHDPEYERFLGVQAQETSGNALTAGKINAFLTLDARQYRAYPDASN